MSGLSKPQQELLLSGIEKMGLDISQQGLAAIEAHLALVQKWRNRINLISISNDRELITHHALDSLALLPLLGNSQQVLDFGTGAGFPGMLLAAARPEASFTLLDSRRRRIEFLRMANAHLGLRNVTFRCARVEALDADGKSMLVAQSDVQPTAKFDTLLARAVASLEVLVEMTSCLRMKGQCLIAMKGRYPHEELAVLQKSHPGQVVSTRVEPLDVPYLDASRHAVVVEF